MSIIAIRCRQHNRTQKLPLDILQFAIDSEGKRCVRRLTAAGQEIYPGPWERPTKPFKSGLYCQHCLNEGNRSPLPVDDEDLPDLGLNDRPIVFLSPKEFRASDAAQSLQQDFPTIRHCVKTLPAIPGQFGDDSVLDRLLPELRTAIRSRIIGETGHLFGFQTEAISAALNGNDVIVTTPTASGKSLTYITPIIDTLLRRPEATALYLSPLVALTADQMESLSALDDSGTDWESRAERFSHHRFCRKLQFGRQILTVARYDGQVSDGDRQYIRKTKPQYLLTTPDMLHVALLNGAFQEKLWAYFFANLRYVVIDELHTYKGVFGASFANLVRRLQRICRAHDTQPIFLCASATMQEPKATVEKLIGRSPLVVDGSNNGAPQNRREFVLWSNQVDRDTRALSTQAKDVLLFALKKSIRTIAFGRSISEINDIYRFVRAELRESGMDEINITPFMRELRPNEKRQIVRDLKNGKIHGVISTTALSMGIDIGSLCAAVVIGFPGSIAALWQEAGRAGRSGDGLIILIADSGPLDQFFVNHPNVLFDLTAEPIYCNPNNPYIVRGHLLCAARELPIQVNEIEQFGPLAQSIVHELVEELWLHSDDDSGGLALTEDGQARLNIISLRNLGFTIDVMTETNRSLIVQVDAARAQRALHKYAHYQHIDRYYEVTRFDVDFQSQRGHIFVKELENPEYTTTARVEREVRILNTRQALSLPRYEARFGEIRSKTDIAGYYKVPLFARNEPFVYQPLGMAAPPPLKYVTHSLWITFDERFLAPYTSDEQVAGLYSLTEAIRLSIAVEELCDPSDLIAVGTVFHPDTERPTALIHDATPGGIGITESAFGKLQRVWDRALLILEQCPYCSEHPESTGCPYCVTAQYGDDSTINRRVAIEIIRQLLNY